MLKNLKKELDEKNISIKKFSEVMGMSFKTAYNKVNGQTEFTFNEAVKVQETFFPTLELKYLFKDEQTKRR